MAEIGRTARIDVARIADRFRSGLQRLRLFDGGSVDFVVSDHHYDQRSVEAQGGGEYNVAWMVKRLRN